MIKFIHVNAKAVIDVVQEDTKEEAICIYENMLLSFSSFVNVSLTIILFSMFYIINEMSNWQLAFLCKIVYKLINVLVY